MNRCKDNPSRAARKFAGFTRSELLVALASLTLLLAVCLPALGTRVSARSARVVCVNNLRQIGAAWRMSATGLNDMFPFQVRSFSAEVLPSYESYLVISNELKTPRILVCPSDSSRTIAPSFDRQFFSSQSISYFIGLDF